MTTNPRAVIIHGEMRACTQKGVLKVTLAASTSPDAAWQLIDDEDDAMAGGAADDDEEDVGDEAEVVLVGYCC